MSYARSFRGLGADPNTYGVPGSPTNPCPPGQHQTCLLARPGQATTADMCSCRVNTQAPVVTQTASAASHNWGLIIGVAVAAIIVVKVAL